MDPSSSKTDPELSLPPPTPNLTLARVGALFADNDSPSQDIDSSFYVLGSIGRLCNEVDDIVLAESAGKQAVAPPTNSPRLAPPPRVPTAYDRETPVFSWESRTQPQDGATLDDLVRKRQKVGSSLAPQSSSDSSEDEEHSEAPSVGQFRPGTDLIQCPVPSCERTFKWKKNLHHHIRDKHPTDAHGLSVMRVQPAQVGAAPSGFRLQSLAIAPPMHVPPMPVGANLGLRCAECGKTFSRKGDLVHHKRYHTRSTDRPYKCNQCGQGFIHHKDLARHMPRHTGQRSFQCPFPDCHKNYTRKDNLNRHMRHDHGGLDASGQVWTGDVQPVMQPPLEAMQQVSDVQEESLIPSHEHSPLPEPPPVPYDSLRALQAIAASAQNHELLQGSPVGQDVRAESPPSEPGHNGVVHSWMQRSPTFRETTPSLGKRPADDPERLATGIKPKRKPKEKWAHRLACPFRKCRSDMFKTESGFRVCETTPHEFIIRLIEHMKRNHDLYVCGECFVAFQDPDSLTHHKTTGNHCGKCYLSFHTQSAYDEHANSCIAVDASTQEDIWQILYETICADGIRHNPSFDDDSSVQHQIQPNNRVRMHLLASAPLSPGQVPSLARRIGSSSHGSGPVPGNGVAPPASRAEESCQQLGPVSAGSDEQAGRGEGSPPAWKREAGRRKEDLSVLRHVPVISCN